MERLGTVGGDAFAACLLQVEDAARLGGGDLRENRACRPLGLRGKVGDTVQQAVWQVACANERDAPHSCKREHVVQRAVGGAFGPDAEGLAQVGEPMRPQARQPHAHYLQRVEPPTAKRVAPCDPLEKRAVEARVVRDDVAPSEEVEQPRHDTLDGRLTADRVVRDAGQLGDLERNGHEWVDERVERRKDLWSALDGGCDLDDVVAVAVVASRLDVEDDDLFLEAEDRALSALCERLVGRDDVGIGTRNEKAMQSLGSHSPRVADGNDMVGLRRDAPARRCGSLSRDSRIRKNRCAEGY